MTMPIRISKIFFIRKDPLFCYAKKPQSNGCGFLMRSPDF